MDPVVVSYFPGAGGFRFIHHLLGESFDQNPRGNYHHDGSVDDSMMYYNPADQYRYPTQATQEEIKDPAPIAYTHAINTDIIKKVYPGRRIIKIKSNLVAALARYWNVEGVQHHQQDIENLGLNTVFRRVMNFHRRYYSETGVDWSADQLINIDQDPGEFCVFMRDQLAQNQSSDAYRYLKNWQFTSQHSMSF
jgi:hypothetical protein